MKDVCAHVRKLAKLTVRKLAKLTVRKLGDGLGVLHNAGISGQKAVDVRPVFVNVRFDRTRYDGARNVAAAAAEGADLPAGSAAVKTGDHHAVRLFGQALTSEVVGVLRVELSVVRKADDLTRVHEFKAEVRRKNHGGKPFALRRRKVGDGGSDDAFLDLLKDRSKVYLFLNAKVLGDADKAIEHRLQQVRKALAFFAFGISGQQAVRNFDVFLKALARRGNHDILAVIIRTNDVRNFLDGFTRRHAAAAEFANFHIYLLCSLSPR